jgi:DNA-binding CsgD family transcriptional regulator
MEAGHWAREYRRVLSLREIREEDCDPALLDYHLPLLERLDAIEGSSIALFDFRTRSYRFLTRSFRFLAGRDRDEALVEGPDYFFRFMKAEHVPFVMETVSRCFVFLNGLPPGERKDYRLSFDFSIQRADGRELRIVQQVVVLELDRRGNIWLVLIANDAAPAAALGVPERHLLNSRTGKYHLFLPLEKGDGRREQSTRDLSRRELEVLGLVAAGMASGEIADTLFISVNTVNNHRQRILEKLGSRSSAEAVRYAASLGLV